MSRPLLVIAHEATRTGSPRVLLELLRYAAPRLDVPIAVRLLAGGGLAGELAAMATAPDTDPRPLAVVANGAMAASELLAIDADVASLVYVHEEGEAVAVLGSDAARGLTERADRVLCVSDRSRAALVDLGVDPDRIAVLRPVVVGGPAVPDHERDATRRRLGAAPGDRLVVGCGEAGWRKGADLFVQVAGLLAGDERLRFAWVGRRNRAFARVLDHDVASLALSERVRWIGEVADAAPFLAVADVLVMTSREDPLPLVPLEAALVGTPTAGFAIGGLVDYAIDGAAATAPYPDLRALARTVRCLLDDTSASAALAAAGAERVARSQSVDVIGSRFVDEVRGLFP